MDLCKGYYLFSNWRSNKTVLVWFMGCIVVLQHLRALSWVRAMWCFTLHPQCRRNNSPSKMRWSRTKDTKHVQTRLEVKGNDVSVTEHQLPSWFWGYLNRKEILELIMYFEFCLSHSLESKNSLEADLSVPISYWLCLNSFEDQKYLQNTSSLLNVKETSFLMLLLFILYFQTLYLLICMEFLKIFFPYRNTIRSPRVCKLWRKAEWYISLSQLLLVFVMRCQWQVGWGLWCPCSPFLALLKL